MRDPCRRRAVALHAADAGLVVLREHLDGVRAAGDRVADQVLLLVEVLLGFEEPDGRHPDHEEQDHHHAPSLQLLQQRGLQVGVGGSRPHRVRDVGLPPLAAAEDEHAAGDREEDGAADRQDDALGLRQPEHHCTATQNGPASGLWIVSVPRGGPRMISAVSTRTSPVSVTVDLEPVHPVRRGAELVLAGGVVLRAVARAFEPLRLLAERDPAPQVHAPLVQRHDPLGRDALGRVVDVALRLAVVLDDVEATGARVERHVVVLDVGEDVVQLAGVDHGTEAAPQVRPQERDRRAPELRAEHQQRCDERAAEELATAHRLGGRRRRFAQDRGAGRGVRLPLRPSGPGERQPEEDREQVDDHDHDDDRDGAA